MILSPFVQTLLILNVLFVLFATIAFVLSVQIAKSWNLNSTSKQQYALEKKSFLGATIIKYIFILKLPLFLFFIFTLDSISHVLTGAMCAAGVVDATPYGTYLFMLKIVNIYLFGSWLLLHYWDMRYETMPLTRMKFALFGLIFLLLVLEVVLEFMMFLSIDIDKMVSCCGVLYSSSATSYISQVFTVPTGVLLSFFYGIFTLIVVCFICKRAFLFAGFNVLFLFISIVSLILFFGTYIYELPTHHCPFCLLQKDYYYVGYVLYSTLFIGTFSGMAVALNAFMKQEDQKLYTTSVLFNTLYVLMVSAYVLVYYLRNGVWL
jgi:hypothetical protein